MKVPEGWPPDQSSSARREVPVFPLPNVFLFPGSVLQLHIFEERYRQMIEDSLDGPGRLVIGTVLEEYENELADAPPIYPIAGLGEIVKHERLEGGRFMIALYGLRRCRITEIESSRLYRKVVEESVVEIPPDRQQEDALREPLQLAVVARSPIRLDLAPDLPLGRLADLLLTQMRLSHAQLQPLYSCLEVAERAQRALVEHENRPLPPGSR